MVLPKGKKCSINGKKYEKSIYKILSNCELNGNLFNTQSVEELGGCSANNDILCNFQTENDIGIEIKKYNTPDWMQCSIKYNVDDKKWETSKNGKIPKECSQIFEELIQNKVLFQGDIPPFFYQQITHKEWLDIKKSTNQWNDFYFDIPNDTIQNLYSIKKCQYIQLSNGFGLYHLGIDLCKFDVPEFKTEQQIRIRTKIHSKSNKNGYCTLSVTAACQPKNIKLLEPSLYSLDDKNLLPKNLQYFRF
jgi:hypothetical protein